MPWLQSKPVPSLLDPNPELKKSISGYFKFKNKVTIKTAVLGPPRVTGNAEPKFYIWLVVKDAKGKVLQEGAGRFVLHDTQGNGRVVELLTFVAKKDLSNEDIRRRTFPFDADIVIAKFLH